MNVNGLNMNRGKGGHEGVGNADKCSENEGQHGKRAKYCSSPTCGPSMTPNFLGDAKREDCSSRTCGPSMTPNFVAKGETKVCSSPTCGPSMTPNFVEYEKKLCSSPTCGPSMTPNFVNDDGQSVV